jgi:membrane associated rhomboid family serine protease
MILPIGDVQKPERTPIINYAFIGINVFVFLFIQPNLSGNRYLVEEFFQDYAFIPAQFSLLTMLYSMFMHADLFHLGGNMLFLWIAGDNVEDRMGKFGYAIFYLTCGYAATLAHYALDMGSDIPTLGASGAIAGVLGAYFLLCPRNQVKVFYWLWFYIGVFYISARVAVGFWFLEQLLFFALGYFAKGTGIAFDAHLGGIIFGFLATLALIELRVVKPYVATERYRAVFRRATPFGTGYGGGQYTPGPGAYEQYSRERGLFTDQGTQRADWISDAYAAPAYTPQWQQQAAGLYTVIAHKPISDRIGEMAPVAAAALNITPPEAASLLSQNYGVIARGVPSEMAQSLQAGLAQLGVQVSALRGDNTIDLPPIQELRTLTPTSMNFTLYLDRFSLTKKYEEIFLIICGQVAGVVTVDVYTYQPWARFRVCEGSRVFEHSTPSNIRSIMMRMLSARNIPVNRGVKVLVDGGEWAGVSYASQEDFDRYCYWLIQVVNAKNRGLM